MRTIKFRGLRTDGKGWVYGDLMCNYTDPSIIDADWGCEYKVIPESVGQFTGLTDKNGVDIYEGDRFPADEDIGEIDCVVMFDSKSGSWQVYSYGIGYSISEGGQEVYDNESSHIDSLPLSDCLFMEVIGNIHEK